MRFTAIDQHKIIAIIHARFYFYSCNFQGVISFVFGMKATKFFIINQLSHGRVIPTYRTLRIALQFNLTKLHRQRIKQQQATDQRLSSLNTNKTPAAKTHASSFLTPGSSGGAGAGLKKLPPAGGMKKQGAKSGLGSGQTSLFGFFKTPAPATNQERGFRAMNTPTTGDFIAM